MKRITLVAAFSAVMLAAALTPGAGANKGVRYYVSLGDSLAAGTNATEVGQAFTDFGYADQLHAALATNKRALKLVKLGCPGESSVSLRFGSQLPTVVDSCGSPQDYKNLYRKGTQLADAVKFLKAHKGEVALVTINIGAGDINRYDEQGNLVSCVFEPTGCDVQAARLTQNLTAILEELEKATRGDVPVVGMTYYDTFAPLCVAEPSLLFVCSRVDALNAQLAAVYEAAGVPVADVAGAFANNDLPSAAANICAWTWFCSHGDQHPNVTGYGVIARAFLDVLTAGAGA